MKTRNLFLLFISINILFFIGIYPVNSNEQPYRKISKSTINAVNVSDPKAVWKRFLEVNRIWIDPHCENLSYSLDMELGSLTEDSTKFIKLINQVHIEKGNHLDWIMTNDYPEQKLRYHMQVSQGWGKYLFPERLKLEGSKPMVDIRNFYQAINWHTAIHELASHQLPENARIVEIQDNGKYLIMEFTIKYRQKQGGQVGLGLMHAHLGLTGFPIYRVRIHIRIPEFIPILEENFDKKGEKEGEIEYGPEFFQFGLQKAPQILRFRYPRPIFDTKQWVLEAHFQQIDNIWILKEGLNIQDGKTVAHIHTENVRTSK